MQISHSDCSWATLPRSTGVFEVLHHFGLLPSHFDTNLRSYRLGSTNPKNKINVMESRYSSTQMIQVGHTHMLELDWITSAGRQCTFGHFWRIPKIFQNFLEISKSRPKVHSDSSSGLGKWLPACKCVWRPFSLLLLDQTIHIELEWSKPSLIPLGIYRPKNKTNTRHLACRLPPIIQVGRTHMLELIWIASAELQCTFGDFWRIPKIFGNFLEQRNLKSLKKS